MKRMVVLILLVSLCLSGCDWFGGSFISVTPHRYTNAPRDNEVVSAANYSQLCSALENMVHSGIESSVIHVADYDQAVLEQEIARAVRYVQKADPIGAYAVETVECELGTSGALPAIAVEVRYRHNVTELNQIQSVSGMEAVQQKLGGVLERCDSSLVLLVSDYEPVDMMQLTEDYAAVHPDSVMEVPDVAVQTYPESGSVRVLELRFSYQNSRDDLRQMKQQVSPVFASAVLYVSGNDADARKFSQLHAFLMERFAEYQIKTSITPAYSLLRHGVGDSQAFAMVYARMCGRAGLECQIVTGTRDGQPWSWNMVSCDGFYYHVDLLSGEFALKTDAQMGSYVWDYSAYPACTGAPAEPDSTED